MVHVYEYCLLDMPRYFHLVEAKNPVTILAWPVRHTRRLGWIFLQQPLN